MIEDNALDTAVGNVLCDYLPDNWEELSEEDLFSFLENNCSEAYEHHPADMIWDEIQSQKYSIMNMTQGILVRSIDVGSTKITLGSKADSMTLNIEVEGVNVVINIPDAKWEELTCPN